MKFLYPFGIGIVGANAISYVGWLWWGWKEPVIPGVMIPALFVYTLVNMYDHWKNPR